MLSVHVVREGGHRYYVDDLVPGRAEGSLVAGEEPGVWAGDGAAVLGLRGTVEADRFAAVLAGRRPATGEQLRSRRAERTVAGYDLTFGAPKSVSLLHLLAPREIATEVGSGHRIAVGEAVGYLSRAAVGVRRVRAGRVALVPSTGMVAGQFLHRTSRALDPHLHTHLVVGNVAQGVDGTWSAIDSRRLFAHVQAAQGIYHASLRLELGTRLGVDWEVRGSGLGDVVGVDPHLRRLFSQRTAAMDEYELRRPGPSPAAARSRGAFLATRPDKDRSRTVETLRAEWRQRAAGFGFDLGDLTRVVGHRRAPRGAAAVDIGRLRAVLDGPGRHRRSVGPHDLVAAVAVASVGGATADTVERVAAQIADAAGRPTSALRPAGPAGPTGGPNRSGPVPEPRWRSADVVRAVERDPGAVLAPVDRLAGTAIGRPARGRRADGPEAAVGYRAPVREPPQLGR